MFKNDAFILVVLVCLSTCIVNSNTLPTTTVVKKSDGKFYDIEDEDRVVFEENAGNLSVILKLATECTTPNDDIGYCIEIKSCGLLLSQLRNRNATKFLTDSKCGPSNEDTSNPKVCCGKHDNFRKPSGGNIIMKPQMKLESAAQASSVAISHNAINITEEECGKQKLNLKGRIFGGSIAVLGEFPWMARLLHKNVYGERHFGCSGFLIHSKYVLTAGHCVHDHFTAIRGPVFSVVLGEHDTESDIDCVNSICADHLQISRIAEVIVHPNYDPEHEKANYNDIALLQLRKGAKMSDYVRPICLKVDHHVPSEYTLSGWGKTETEQVSRYKMKVELPPVNRSNCAEQYSYLNVTLKESQMCAGGENGRDSCNGDSGGPLMYYGNDNLWYAAGIVSFGIGCGTDDWPGVYTNVSHYVPWIKQMISDRTKRCHRKDLGKTTVKT